MIFNILKKEPYFLTLFSLDEGGGVGIFSLFINFRVFLTERKSVDR